jgi:hypothetical protein
MRLGIWKSQHFGGGVFTVLIIVDSSSLNHKVTNLSERASGMFVRNFLHYWKASMCRYDLYIKDVSLCEQEKAGGKRQRKRNKGNRKYRQLVMCRSTHPQTAEE